MSRKPRIRPEPPTRDESAIIAEGTANATAQLLKLFDLMIGVQEAGSGRVSLDWELFQTACRARGELDYWVNRPLFRATRNAG